MRIAICDNEAEAVKQLHTLCEQQSGITQIRDFLSLQVLQETLEEGAVFDVILMDIDWNQEDNGIDFAAKLFAICPCSQIIYVTGYNDRFVQQIFLKPVNLCGYLLKPVDPGLLEALLHKAQENLHHLEEEKLLLQQKGVVHSIPFHTIVYLESMGHQIIVHTKTEHILSYEQLESLKRRLPARFLQCHKSYLVNMDYVRRIDKNRMILESGEQLPISKAKYGETRTAYFRYMGETL